MRRGKSKRVADRKGDVRTMWYGRGKSKRVTDRKGDVRSPHCGHDDKMCPEIQAG